MTIARYAIGITAAAALAAFAAVARASHPGTAHRTSTIRATSSSSAQADDSFFSGSFSDIGPSGSASAQVQSGAS